MSSSPLVAALFELRMFNASLTFLGTDVGGCGGAEFGKEVGPAIKIDETSCIYIDTFLGIID